MRLDIYRRVEQGARTRHLAAPAGMAIPANAGGGWRTLRAGVEIDDGVALLADYRITQPLRQIACQGYAIGATGDTGDTGAEAAAARAN